MSTKLQGLLALVLCAVPGLAYANRIKVASYKFSPEGGVVELQAQEPIGEPSLRLEGKKVHIWFPDIEHVSHFEEGDSGQAIRAVRLRSGADNTAVLVFEIRSARSFRRDDLVITRDGASASVRVHVEPASPVVERPLAPQIPAALTTPRAASTKELPPAQTQPPPTGSAPVSIAVVPPVFASPTKLKAKEAPRFLAPDTGPTSTIGLLVLSSLALGALYGFIRLRQPRIPGADRMPIEVIASKRLGQKHELVLIRAMGQDHLLSLHAGKIERLSSAPAAMGADNESREFGEPRQEPGSFGSLLGKHMRGAIGGAGYRGAGAPKAADEDKVPFGEDLLSFVRDQGRKSAVGKKPLMPGHGKHPESESVAGIARMRNRIAS